MGFTSGNVSSLYTRIRRETIDPTLLSDIMTAEAGRSDGDITVDLANLGFISPREASMQNAYWVVQIIQLATGVVPTLAQQTGWVDYLNAGGSNTTTSMNRAFVASDAFGTLYNGGTDVSPDDTITATVVAGIIKAAHAGGNPDGSATQAQIDAWVGTGLTMSQVFNSFALGDQFSALTQPYIWSYYVQNLLVYINANIETITPTPSYPSGNLFDLGTIS